MTPNADKILVAVDDFIAKAESLGEEVKRYFSPSFPPDSAAPKMTRGHELVEGRDYREGDVSKEHPIGSEPAFPDTDSFNQPCPGMTYRQWLIGMVASGCNTCTDDGTIPGAARTIIQQADAILEKLEAEDQ